MTKTNPLFVDSTKFHGDPIATQIELQKVIPYDDERLVAIVTNHQGISRRIEMTLSEAQNFEARLSLNHQQPITCQFFIEKQGVTLFHSRPYKGRAQYALIQEWEPLPGAPEPTLPSLSAGGFIPAKITGNASWAKETSQGIKSLMDKWGF